MQEDLFATRSNADLRRNVLIDGPDGQAICYDDFFDATERAQIFAQLRNDTAWNQETISLYGKVHPIPRLTAWYGDKGASYKYSNIKNDPHPWTTLLESLRSRIRAVSDAKFNSVLLNLYRHGTDSVSWHADDERELGNEPTIASMSFGVSRKFQLRRRVDKTQVETVLTDGSLLIMGGRLQQTWLHQVPKQAKITGERINLTFRLIGQS